MSISYYTFLLSFITCVRFRNKKISFELLLHLCKYYVSKIQKSSYLYIKRLLPEGIIHFRKSDTFQQKPIIQQSFKTPHCYDIQMVHSQSYKTHIHFLPLISYKPQKIKVSLKADKRFQYWRSRGTDLPGILFPPCSPVVKESPGLWQGWLVYRIYIRFCPPDS